MKITSFGEVLWDDFPGGKVLGGAPLNVLVRLAALGADGSIISSRGEDQDGEILEQQVSAKGVSTQLLQRSPDQPTSLVKVKLDADGIATYDIVYPCAWDRIRFQEEAAQRVAESDAFIYGSLSARDPVSSATLEQLLERARFKIFDVNLRPPHYQSEQVLALMKQADLIKLNDDELYELAEAAGSHYHSMLQHMLYLSELTHTPRLCVTLGGHGAVYLEEGRFYHHNGYRVKVVDTVGSGDSFLAGLIHKLLDKAPADDALAFACALGALVAAHQGATPDISLQDIEMFMNPMP
ncbi:MAG: carbohydrate kinase [Lautropia sp.]|nr:carbohydrate kinase [Lautropia sp.]